MSNTPTFDRVEWFNDTIHHLEGLCLDNGKPCITCDLLIPEDFPFKYNERVSLNESLLARLIKRAEWLDKCLKEPVYVQVPKFVGNTPTDYRIKTDDFEVVGTGVQVAELTGFYEDARSIYLQMPAIVWVALGAGRNYLHGRCRKSSDDNTLTANILTELPVGAVSMLVAPVMG